MAIIQCEKCGKKYSDKAPACPICTKKERKQASPLAIILGLAAVAIFIGIGATLTPDTPATKPDAKSTKPVNRLTETQAYIMSQQFVKDRLKAPATADFPWQDEATIRKTGPGEFLVLSYVDAQNAFGANIRNHYACKISSDDNGKTWNLVEFSFANQ